MNSLKQLCRIELDQEITDTYVGLSINKGQPSVVFPRGYNLGITNYEIYKDIVLLIKVLDKYRERKSSQIFETYSKNINGGVGEHFPFKTAIYLIRDYQANGLYCRDTEIYKLDKKGKIDWGKTIKKQIPQISNENYVYLDFITRSKKKHDGDIIRLIHAKVINMCIEHIGWLFPGQKKIKMQPLSWNRTMCINKIKQELNTASKDSHKRLLRYMIEFLTLAGEQVSQSTFKEYKTEYFNLVWQDMLTYVLGNDTPNKYYPNAVWHIGGKEIPASNLQPDIILRHGKVIYVLDAKYYKYGITRKVQHLPQSSDIIKQLLYSTYIENMKIEQAEVAMDAFLLPYAGSGIETIGYADVGNKLFGEHRVVTCLLNTKEVMKTYIDDIDNDKLKFEIIRRIDKCNNYNSI